MLVGFVTGSIVAGVGQTAYELTSNLFSDPSESLLSIGSFISGSIWDELIWPGEPLLS